MYKTTDIAYVSFASCDEIPEYENYKTPEGYDCIPMHKLLRELPENIVQRIIRAKHAAIDKINKVLHQSAV